MNRKEVIKQLEELIEDRKSFMVGDYDEVYDKDVQALEYVIKELTAQEVPVQEQYVININSSSVSNEINHKIVQKFLNQQDNNLLFDHRI